MVIGPTIRALISERAPTFMGLSMGLLSFSSSIGSSLGSMFGCRIAQRLSSRYPFYLSSILYVITALAASIGLREERRKRGGIAEGLRELIGITQVRVTYLLAVVVFSTISAIRAFLPLYAAKMGVSTSDIGLMFAAMDLIGLIGIPMVGRLSDVFGRIRVLALIVGASSLLLFSYIIAEYTL